MAPAQTSQALAVPDHISRPAPASAWRLEAPWLALVAAGSLAIAVPRFLMQLAYGPGWDAYTFLLNALDYAGRGTSSIEIYRPPVLPFLMSLVNRAGLVEVWPIFAIDLAVTLVGVLGLYLLLREGVSGPIAALGTLAFLTFPDTIENLAAGVTDLMAVSVSIWIVYLTLLALRKDTRYLRLAIALVPIAFMTRFTAGLMLAVVVLAIVYDAGRRHLVRDVVAGLGWSVVVLVPYFAYHWWRFGDPLIQLWEPFVAATATQRVGMLAGAIEPTTFFITGAPAMMSYTPLGWGMLLLVLDGMALCVAALVATRSEPLSAARWTVLAVLAAACTVLVVGPTSFTIVVAGWFLLLGVLVPAWLTGRDDDRARFLVVMIFWFVMYLTVHSHMLVKVTRYVTTMLPVLVLFLVYPLEVLRERLARAPLSARIAVPVAGTVVALALAFSARASFARLDTLGMADFHGYGAARAWTDANVPGNALLASDVYPPLRYRLGRTIYPVPPFDVKQQGAAQHWLDANGVDFFVTIHDYPPWSGFERVFHAQDVSIYKRATAPPSRADVLLIGRAVDRHLNDVLGPNGPYIHAPLNVIPDDYGSKAGTFIDEYSLAQLRRHDAVLLYWFRWHDRGAAERLIREYVAGGGTVMIDASENLGGLPDLPWGIEGTTWLDVLVERGPVPSAGRVVVSEPALLVDGAPPVFGRFVSEEGGAWYGAQYSTRFATGLRTLVAVGGTPLVIEQRIGRGRVLWVGSNLGFHAFLRGTVSEKRFVGRLLAYATAPSFEPTLVASPAKSTPKP